MTMQTPTSGQTRSDRRAGRVILQQKKKKKLAAAPSILYYEIGMKGNIKKTNRPPSHLLFTLDLPRRYSDHCRLPQRIDRVLPGPKVRRRAAIFPEPDASKV